VQGKARYIGIEALNSVPAAIFSFLAHPQDFVSTVTYAVSPGGDTDIIASMAGAISGAYLGIDGLPSRWLGQLENRDYISNLADKLWQTALLEYPSRANPSCPEVFSFRVAAYIDNT